VFIKFVVKIWFRVLWNRRSTQIQADRHRWIICVYLCFSVNLCHDATTI